METIQLLSRKSFRFANPDVTLLSKDWDKEKPDISKKSVTNKLEEAYFIIPSEKINKVVVAPAWVKTDPIFSWAVSDGDLMEVNVGMGRAAEAQAESLAQSSEAERLKKEQEAMEAAEAKKEELSLLNKADLIDHAKENYNLELSPSMKKEDMQAAILDAHAAEQK